MRFIWPILLVVGVFAAALLANGDATILRYPMFFAWHFVMVFIIAGVMWLVFIFDPKNKK